MDPPDTPPARLIVDHVAIAVGDLTAAQAAYSTAGFHAVYGGLHSSGATHMAVATFTDGSYLELIAVADPSRLDDNPFWTPHLLENGGPCGWAARVDDIESEVARLEELGCPIHGPLDGSRRRPDGREVLWRMAFPGNDGPGATLPFLIEDVTPRSLRVPPAPAQSSIAGVSAVLLAVPHLDSAATLYQHLYGWTAPLQETADTLGARLASFPDTPVVLASPVNAPAGEWLRRRLERFGPSPCAYVFGGRRASSFAGLDPSWLDPEPLGGARVGICYDGPQA